MARAANLRLEGISKGYGPNRVLDDVSLDIGEGEFVALIGPSGCGKSTLLRAISGLEPVDAGRIAIGDRDVTDVRPADRDVAMVFQSYALYPHLTARQNIALPLAMRQMTAAQRVPLLGRLFGSREAARDIAREVETTAAALKISALLDRKPAQMSGGQRQRVALGRAIVRHPRVFLMDEPLSNLDVALRVHMRSELVDLHRRLGVTTVYVTHDQAEALSMASRIAVLMHGRPLQVATPEALYRDPDHLDVAEFVGTPRINVLAAELDRDGTIRRPDGTILGHGFPADRHGPVRVAIRPEHLWLGGPEPRPDALRARLDRLEFQGSERLAHLTTDEGEPLTARLAPDRHVAGDDGRLRLVADARSWLVFDGDGLRLRPSAAAAAATLGRPVLAHG